MNPSKYDASRFDGSGSFTADTTLEGIVRHEVGHVKHYHNLDLGEMDRGDGVRGSEGASELEEDMLMEAEAVTESIENPEIVVEGEE